MRKPIVSVIIPFYNRIDWLLEAVQSVLSQTFSFYELIVIDDGSTEDVGRLFDYKDSRIIYVRQENKGCSVARNWGIQLAKGKYIAFLDADDLFSPSKLEVQYQYMEQHPEVVLTHTSYQRVDCDCAVISNQHSGRYAYNHYIDLIVSCPLATPTVMVRKEFVDEHHLRFPVGTHIGEDIFFWVSVAKYGWIEGIDNLLTKVRMHGENASEDFFASINVREMLVEHILTPDGDLSSFRTQHSISRVLQESSKTFYLNCRWSEALWYSQRAIRSCPLRFPVIVFYVGRYMAIVLIKRLLELFEILKGK